MTMIKFNLNNNFKMVQEGTRTLEITECSATPSGFPTEMRWTLKDIQDGATMKDSCNITAVSTNIWKISRIASAVLNINDGEEMDAVELAKALVGKKITCEIVHNKGKNPREDGTYPTFANIKTIIGAYEETVSLPKIMVESSPRASIIGDDL